MNNFSDSLEVDATRLEDDTTRHDPFSVSASAPGKVILFGEHSVVHGKLALAASLGLRTKVSLTEHELTEIGTNRIDFNLHSVNLMHCYDLEDIQNNLLRNNSQLFKNISLEKPDSAHYENFSKVIEEYIKDNSGSMPLTQVQHQALFALFYLLMTMVGCSGISLRPFTLDIQSDLTLNAGLGSSASYAVTIAAVFFQLIRFKTSKREDKKAKNCVKSTANLSKKDITLISRWAYSAERIMHGSPSGLDNTTCTFGSVVEFRRNSLMKPMELRHKLQILLINTRVPKDTKALVAKVARLKEKYPQIVDNILSAMECIANSALEELLRLDEMASSEKLTPEDRQRKTIEIYESIGDIVDFNQNLLRSLQVSHPSLDHICSVLAEVGLHGKLTGAGGGGYAFAIVPAGFERVILEEVIGKLNQQGYDATLTDLGGPGLVVT